MAVSVAMCTYNCGRHLAKAIESVLAQTFREFELIVVDDGSTDGTGDIIDHYAQKDARTKPLRNNENVGIPASVNMAVMSARNDLVARFDSDDVMLPNRLERQVWFMSAHPEISVAASYSYLINDRGTVLGETRPKVDVEKGKSTQNPSLFVDIVQPTVMLRKRHFVEIGGYRDLPVLSDRDLWGRFVTNGYLIAVQDEFLLLNRRYGNNISLEKHLLGARLGNLIDHNIKRRLRGLNEHSIDECENSYGLLWHLNNRRQVVSALHFRKAVLAYGERDWGSLFVSSAVSAALCPISTPLRAMGKIAFHSRPDEVAAKSEACRTKWH